jgi:hypothetical protein
MKHVYESGKLYYEVGAISAEQLREYEDACVVAETPQTANVSPPPPAYAEAARKH